MRQRPKSLKPKAKLSVAPKSPKNQSARVRDLEKRLAESLEQQTATSEILRVISSSPTDVQPVFEAMAANAVTGAGRAVLDGRTVHVADMQNEANEFPESTENARRTGFRTILVVPLMREGAAIGTINLRRTEVQPFTERQVALLHDGDRALAYECDRHGVGAHAVACSPECGVGGAQGEPGVSSKSTALDKSAAARDPGPVRPVATGFNGDRGHAMLGVQGQMRLAASFPALEPG